MKQKIPKPFVESITEILFETKNNPEGVALHFWKEILQVKKEEKQDFVGKLNKCKIHTSGALILIEVKELMQRLNNEI